MMLLSDNFWWLPWTAVVVRNIMKVSHQYVPHAYFSTSILLAMKHSIISVLWMKLKLGHCLQLIKPNSSLLSYRSCSPTGQAITNSVNTLLWWAPTPPDGVKVNLRWQPWSAKKLSDKCELWQCEDVSKWRLLHHPSLVESGTRWEACTFLPSSSDSICVAGLGQSSWWVASSC